MNETWTLPGQIARLARERPDRKALIEMGPDGGWVSTSWGEYWQAVRDLAKGLIAEGFQAWESGDHALLTKNAGTVLRAAHHLFSATTTIQLTI